MLRHAGALLHDHALALVMTVPHPELWAKVRDQCPSDDVEFLRLFSEELPIADIHIMIRLGARHLNV
jgi:hypothetical protein